MWLNDLGPELQFKIVGAEEAEWIPVIQSTSNSETLFLPPSKLLSTCELSNSAAMKKVILLVKCHFPHWNRNLLNVVQKYDRLQRAQLQAPLRKAICGQCALTPVHCSGPHHSRTQGTNELFLFLRREWLVILPKMHTSVRVSGGSTVFTKKKTLHIVTLTWQWLPWGSWVMDGNLVRRYYTTFLQN
jgi:hypothetical protein